MISDKRVVDRVKDERGRGQPEPSQKSGGAEQGSNHASSNEANIVGTLSNATSKTRGGL